MKLPLRMVFMIFLYAALLIADAFLLALPGEPDSLYPALFGGLLLLLGGLALKEELRLIAGHATALVTLLAFILSVSSVGTFFTTAEAGLLVVQKAVMALLSILFLSLFVFEFIHARKKADAQ